ncbi:hypothetical protein ANO14919_091790 [Xylariales sp. No.14919]|nr:hypothetical protein ANO14919_091790 [Xylariales sp. No.14919]
MAKKRTETWMDSGWTPDGHQMDTGWTPDGNGRRASLRRK